MTTQTVFPTPLPDGEDPGPEPRTDAGPLTIHHVFALLNAHRAAVHETLQELRASGAPVSVPFDAVFLCELAGLVVDLQTGAITGLAEGRAPAPVAALRARLATQFGPVVDSTVRPA